MNWEENVQEEYDERFFYDDEEISKLMRSEISPEIANKYKGFNAWEIALLHEWDITPKKANKFNSKFKNGDIVKLFEAKISPKLDENYSDRFDKEDITILLKDGIYPNKANKYDNFDCLGIALLVQQGIASYIAKKYKGFSAFDIITLIEENISFTLANDYSSRFHGEEILRLIEEYIKPGYAKEYDKIFRGIEIIILNKIRANPKDTTLTNEIFEVFQRIVHYQDIRLKPENFRILGTGASAAVLLKENVAWKFSLEIAEEYEILKKIQQAYKGNQKNVIKLMGEPKKDIILKRKYSRRNSSEESRKIIKENIVFEIEYIQGNSLENILKKRKVLSKEKVLKYSSNIMNGLIEMRQAGIWYHRDIRPANIMIDFDNDRAIIIDLGKATTDKKALQIDNTRFGAPNVKGYLANDLISLGQVMYYMATGEHIFAESESQTRTFSDIADEINDYRNKVYSDESRELLKKHLKQVDETIEDKKVRDLIKICLTSKHYDYTKIKRMFKK